MLQVTDAGGDVFPDFGKLNVIGQLWKPLVFRHLPIGIFIFDGSPDQPR
jgi:hypothetical protein